MEFNCTVGHGRSCKIEVICGRLVIANFKATEENVR